MPRTDDINQVAGTYNCESCGEPILVALWHRFPPCPRCGKYVDYPASPAGVPRPAPSHADNHALPSL
jgi:rRNA maturation protein Nop10